MTSTNDLRKLADLIDGLDNEDAVLIDYAIKAMGEMRPAYWTKAKYHNAASCVFAGETNLYGIVTAIANVPPHKKSHIPSYIADLIPLNFIAEHQHEAYKSEFPHDPK